MWSFLVVALLVLAAYQLGQMSRDEGFQANSSGLMIGGIVGIVVLFVILQVAIGSAFARR
jgi:hypothetical protein